MEHPNFKLATLPHQPDDFRLGVEFEKASSDFELLAMHMRHVPQVDVTMCYAVAMNALSALNRIFN
jgi:hypothetical protein